MTAVEKLRIGKRVMLTKKEEVTNFPHLKSNPPVHRWFSAFADVFGILRRRRWVKCEIVVVGKLRLKKKKCSKNIKNSPIFPIQTVNSLCPDRLMSLGALGRGITSYLG
jgi:hypothetical protein